MYQWLVVGLCTASLLCTGYYFTLAYDTSIANTSIVLTDPTRSTSSRIFGTYVCDTDTGCSNPRVLTLSRGGGVQMTTTYESGAEIVRENGTWASGRSASLNVRIVGTEQNTYSQPVMLKLKRVGTSTYQGGTSSSMEYQDWPSSLFSKQSVETE
jgi:hypothetical protein